MKMFKLAIGSLALFVAVGGAYASAVNHSTITAFYVTNDGEDCLPVETECTVSGANCIQFIDATQGFEQLYRLDEVDGSLPCKDPLKDGL